MLENVELRDNHTFLWQKALLVTGSPGTGLSGSTEVVLLTTMDEISMKHQLQIKKQE